MVELPRRGEISETEARLRTEIAKSEYVVRGEIKTLESRLSAEVKGEFARLSGRIDATETRMNDRFSWQWWANGAIVALLVGLCALLIGLYTQPYAR